MADKKGELPFADIRDLEWCDLDEYRRVFSDLLRNAPCRLGHSLYCSSVLYIYGLVLNGGKSANRDVKAFLREVMEYGPEMGVFPDGSENEKLPENYYSILHPWHDERLSNLVAPLSILDVSDVADCVDGAPVEDEIDVRAYPADFALLSNEKFMSDAALVSLNLNATDDEILSAVKDFLPAYRKALNSRGAEVGLGGFSEKSLNGLKNYRFSGKDLEKVVKYRVIEYFHISMWADFIGVKVKDVTMANYLFGGDLNIEDPVAHFAKTAKPYINKFKSRQHAENFYNWAAQKYGE